MMKVHSKSAKQNVIYRTPVETIPQKWDYPPSTEYDWENLGFIMLRCVRSKSDDEMWIECYNCIRKFYPNKILIIDDHSNLDHLSKIGLENCEIVDSEFTGGQAELLPFYYFYKLKPFNKAVILQDSTFIRAFIDWKKFTSPITSLWYFNISDQIITNSLIQHLENSTNIEKWFKDYSLWQGCFGLMCVITWDFVYELQSKTKFFNLLSIVNKREHRYELEKLFGCICSWVYPNFGRQHSVMGNIVTQFNKKQTFLKYKQGYYNDKIVKVWCGR